MKVQFRARLFSLVFSVSYIISSVFAVFLPINSSYAFLLHLFLTLGMLVVASLTMPHRPSVRIIDGMLLLFPVVVSSSTAIYSGIMAPVYLPYFALYVMYGLMILLSGAINYREIILIARFYVATCTLLLAFGVISMMNNGSFSPFQAFNINDPSLSKNVFCAMLIGALGLAGTRDIIPRSESRLFLIILLVIGILATESRAGLIALAVGAVLWFPSFAQRFTVLVILALAGTALLIADVQLEGVLLGRVYRLLDLGGDLIGGALEDEGNLDYRRVALAFAGWQGFLDRPIFGWGSGQDVVAIGASLEKVTFASSDTIAHIVSRGQGAHNQYLKNLIEYGILSIFWTLLYLKIARGLLCKKRLFSGFVALLVFSATNSVLTGLSIFPLFFIYYCLSKKTITEWPGKRGAHE